MSRIGEVRDLRGMGILLKQIATATKNQSAATSNSNKPTANVHQFLGRLAVQLKTVPVYGGMERWYPLEGRNESSSGKSRGEIRLALALSANHPHSGPITSAIRQSFIEYERLLRIVVEYQVRTDAEWRGVLPEAAAVALRQLAAQRGLRPLAADVCAFSVYAAALHKRQLDFVAVVAPLVVRLRKTLQEPSGQMEELVAVFFKASDQFVGTALSILRYWRGSGNVKPDQLAALLQ